MTYIIKDGSPIARSILHIPDGPVRCSYRLKTEDQSLVNAFDAMVSNDKKWEGWEERNSTHLSFASLANGGVFIRP